MSRTIKIQKKATKAKQAKGHMAGRDDSKKPKCPHQQPKPSWVTPKSGK